MDDKVSQWLLNNWYNHSAKSINCLVAVVVARHINLPSTLERIGYPSGATPIYSWLDKVKRKVRELQQRGMTAYNGAYMVRGIGTADKIEMIADYVCKPLVDNPPGFNVPLQMQQCVEALLPYWGLSSFMAGQVVADLRWAWPPTEGRKGYWADRFTYAPIGPGSLKGMNYLHGRPAKQSLKQQQFQKELVELIAKLNKYACIKHIMKRAEAMDIQNCLCEYRAYYQALHGIKLPKRRYQGV
jgi:hypothetical protein